MMNNRAAAPWPQPEIADRPVGATILEAELAAGLEVVGGGGRWMAGVAWAASGVLMAVLLRARGHEFQFFALWGVLLGPLFLPLAVELACNREPSHPIRIRLGAVGKGDFDVLVVMLGPSEATADVRPLLDALRPHLGRLTVAGLVPYEAAGRTDWEDEKPQARLRLEQAALFLGDYDPGLVLLPGGVRRAVPAFATISAVSLVVLIGRPGGGAIARVLAARCRVPVASIHPLARA